jgi:hypothetical protein
MGWWKVQGSDNTIGDLPLDVLEKAVSSVLADYQEALARPPSIAEWECLLRLVLSSRETERVFAEDGSVRRVEIQIDAPDQ